ncbi:hypothetical protein EDB81DRAFT_829100 [Dactylonectria macrodidyma]|uniref:Chromo domain-containing protein n=1 Tax=Dactylonectria macrodidyma TaxID=307937 RepID=A0A9P9D244_9HYPO|nr:hypothetical protein EDB81DRAFT_829100 [Dactylonectria macrodidyma]
MARKKASELTHPGRSHPTFTAEEAKERERQRQRDKRARRKLERRTRRETLDTENTESTSHKEPILWDEHYNGASKEADLSSKLPSPKINSHNAYTLHRGLEGTTDPREIRSHSTTSERGGPLYTNCDSPGPDGAHATCRYSSEEDPLNVEDGVVLEAGESDTLVPIGRLHSSGPSGLLLRPQHTARSQSKGSPSSSSLPSFSPHLGSTPPRTIAVPDSQGKSGANISAQSMRGDGDSKASDSGRSSPLSSLQENWLQEPSLFVAVDEDEAGGTSDYSGSDRSTDEEDAPYREYGKRLRVKTVNNSKYSTAAAWVQAHMLDEPVCNTCLDEAGQVGRDDGLSLQEMATYIRDLGVPDALASSKPTTEGDQPWEEALSGGAAPPVLNMAKSHQPDGEVTAQYDVDAVLAEVSSLQAFRGFRFSYYPRSQRNLQKPIHVQFHGKQLHRCRHIRFGEALFAHDIHIYIAFPRMPLINETFLTEEQHALWIDGVVLPSIRDILPPTSMQHFPATWAIGASLMRAKHNEHRTLDIGGTNPIHYAVSEASVSGLWEAMLSRLSDLRFSIFRGMFIVFEIYGTKTMWTGTSFSNLRDNVLSALDKSIDRRYLIPEKTYFDVGKETISRATRVHWWKTCCLQHWLDSADPQARFSRRTHPMSGTRDAASMNIRPPQQHFLHPHVVYAQRYNSYKELSDARKTFPFTNHNIESMLIPHNLLQLWSKAGGAHWRTAHVDEQVAQAGKRSYSSSKQRLNLTFRDSQTASLGTREEYRVQLEVFEILDLDSQPFRHAEPRPYFSIPTPEALYFLRWDLNRWLGALDYLLISQTHLTPASGAMGTMLARVIKAISIDSASGHSNDLYRDSYFTKQGVQWLGLGIYETTKETGMVWLKRSMFDWEQLRFHESVESQIRFFIPDSQRTYKQRQRQVSAITKLYHGISNIAKSLKRDGSAGDDHKLNRIRRICFLALTMEMLKYGKSHQSSPPPKDLESYNYGICKAWLVQYYSGEPYIPRDWRICHTWQERPTWAQLIQQLFDWDDQHLYKVPFTRQRWDNLQYRLVTRHAFQELSQALGLDVANDWRKSLGIYGCQFFWMLPKCSGTRFTNPVKIRGEGSRINSMSWYSAGHVELVKYRKTQALHEWNWADQDLWDWQGGLVEEHMPNPLFDDVEEFNFDARKGYIIPPIQKCLTGNDEGSKCKFEVYQIVGKRELRPRCIEYHVAWVGYPDKKDYTWEPVWQLKADVPKIVNAYERKQRDARNSQK